ncbi:apolipoprotein N-acyltransferase [candidate division NPL-UPA2 bacterium]|nr:apolipoprotein N-acyltransferase [candidate division NPL-UPA2 bacterium]
MTNILLSSLSGVLLVLCFPKFDLEILAWVALVPLLLAIRDKGGKEAFILSYLSGAIFFTGLLYWIATVTVYSKLVPLGLLILISYLALYFGLFGLLLSIQNQESRIKNQESRKGHCFHSLRSLLVAPSLWVSLEFIRSHLFSGFPWGLIGYSQHLNLPLIQICSLTGVYGVSFLIVLVNVAIMECLSAISGGKLPGRFTRFREDSLNRFRNLSLKGLIIGCHLLVAFFLLGGSLFYGKRVLREEMKGKSLKVAIVQGNIPQEEKWDYERLEDILAVYSKLTREASKEAPHLIVWPETALPGYLPEDRQLLDKISRLAQESNAYILLGAAHREYSRQQKCFNSAFLISPSGAVETVYNKIHLVPFGEFVPLGRLFPRWERAILPGGGFEPGKNFTVFSLPQGRFGAPICFEAIFPHLVRNFVRRGANFIVNITNDAWFGRTAGPYQHLAMVSLRAVENRLPLVRAANTGISCFIDPFGHSQVLEVEGERIFVRGVLIKEIVIPEQETFYARRGDIFAYICLLLTLFILAPTIWKLRH